MEQIVIVETDEQDVATVCLNRPERLNAWSEDLSAALLEARNRRRDSPLSGAVMSRLLGRWEVPDLTEAHELTWVT